MNINKSAAIQVSGWALIVTGIAFTMLFIVWYIVENLPLVHLAQSLEPAMMVAALIFGPFLLAIGLLGLRARYGDAVGNTGKTLLQVGTILGLVIALVGVFGVATNPGMVTWIFYGLGVQMAALVLFGLLGVRSKPLPCWNGLPILAGIVYPVFFVVNELAPTPEEFGLFVLIGLVTQFLAMVVLGFVLQGDAKVQEMSMAAA